LKSQIIISLNNFFIFISIYTSNNNMKFEVTNPKAWKAVNEKNIPMSHKIKVYEKLGGAYRLGESGGEQVFNKMTELLKHKMNENDESSPEETIKGLTEMTMGQLERIGDYASMIADRMSKGQQLDSWMYSQITLAVDQLNSVHDAMDGTDGEKEPLKEGVSSKEMDTIKKAVEAASSFMNVGAQLKSAGLRYTFATEPLAIYIVQPTANNKVAIINKRYASNPDFVVGDIAVGVMD
jgi:hypothetical protein